MSDCKHGYHSDCPFCKEDELTTLRTRLEEVEADASVMREALYRRLERCCQPDGSPDGGFTYCEECQQDLKTLATNAGKSLLERLKEAEWLILHAGDPNWRLGYEESNEWLKRRDAFLNPTNKDK